MVILNMEVDIIYTFLHVVVMFYNYKHCTYDKQTLTADDNRLPLITNSQFSAGCEHNSGCVYNP